MKTKTGKINSQKTFFVPDNGHIKGRTCLVHFSSHNEGKGIFYI
ncbi:unnamed protein product [Callosobruchus maculatus]|uniref:Uncharacterized protein n=1 Tax=Callosobruchus maculatus TaxID=64391 RepID=A0A653DQM0_CALMS|nr:unnamed protein product [Callosobruchus maculatus]